MKTLLILMSFTLMSAFGSNPVPAERVCDTEKEHLIGQIEQLVKDPNLLSQFTDDEAEIAFMVDDHNKAHVVEVITYDYLLADHIGKSVNEVEMPIRPGCRNIEYKFGLQLANPQ